MTSPVFPSPSRSFDPDADVRAEIEIAHALTRFHRATMGRRARAIGQFAADRARIVEATRLREISVTDIVTTLPEPVLPDTSLAAALNGRRSSERGQLGDHLPLEALSALLNLAARSHLAKSSSVAPECHYRLRPYPSAGGLYPCELYVLRPGAPPEYYDPTAHALVDYGMPPADFRAVETAPQDTSPPCAIVITADLDRVMPKYGGRGYRFALLEAGQIGQNLVLAAEALGLPALPYGAYFDAELETTLGIDGLNHCVVSVVLIGAQCVQDTPQGESL